MQPGKAIVMMMMMMMMIGEGLLEKDIWEDPGVQRGSKQPCGF